MTGQLSLRAVTSGDQPFLLALVDSTREDLGVLDRTLRGMLVRMQHDAQASDYRRRFPRHNRYRFQCRCRFHFLRLFRLQNHPFHNSH